jgi:hypothetical protein
MEDRPTRSGDPVAGTVAAGGYPYDVMQVTVRRGAVIASVAKRENPAVTGNEPVALTIRGPGYTGDRCSQVVAGDGAVKLRIAEGEDPAVPADQPITPTVGCRSHPDNLVLQWPSDHGAVKAGSTKGKYLTVSGHQPVARTVRGRGHRHYRPPDMASDLAVPGRVEPADSTPGTDDHVAGLGQFDVDIG